MTHTKLIPTRLCQQKVSTCDVMHMAVESFHFLIYQFVRIQFFFCNYFEVCFLHLASYSIGFLFLDPALDNYQTAASYLASDRPSKV